MRIKIELTGIPSNTSESDEFKKRQQNIDLLLVLSKLLEINMVVPSELVHKAQSKISSLLDKV